MHVQCVGPVLLAGLILTAACDAADLNAADLEPRAREVVAQLVANDWATIRTDFDSTMRDGLSEKGLADAWKSIIDFKGEYVSHEDPYEVPKPGKHIVFDTKMTFRNGEAKNRVTFDRRGRIAGFFILEPNVP